LQYSAGENKLLQYFIDGNKLLQYIAIIYCRFHAKCHPGLIYLEVQSNFKLKFDISYYCAFHLRRRLFKGCNKEVFYYKPQEKHCKIDSKKDFRLMKLASLFLS